MCKLNKMLNIMAGNISDFTVDEGLGTYILVDENNGNVTSSDELLEGIFNVTDRGICVCVCVCMCVPADPDDLPERRKKSGFDNLNFRYPKGRLGVTRRCVAARRLPGYPVAAIHTGQFQHVGRNRYEQLRGEELRFAEGDRGAAHPR